MSDSAKSVIELWSSKGSYFISDLFNLHIFYCDLGISDSSSTDTLLILHGFPESSYSFQKVLDSLQNQFKRIVILDFPGYGLSDKPRNGYGFGIFEQTDAALELWHYLGISGGHILAHDMGNSVAAELCHRQNQAKLIDSLPDGLLSVTFTNGSLVLGLAELRITQRLLLSPVGFMLSRLTFYALFRQQVQSAHGNDALSEEDIRWMWEFLRLKQGHQINHLLINYIRDRRKHESIRWLPALRDCQVPIHLCWGSDDAVARVEMAYFLKSSVCPNASLSIMQGAGHFCQIAHPELWSEKILAFYR